MLCSPQLLRKVPFENLSWINSSKKAFGPRWVKTGGKIIKLPKGRNGGGCDGILEDLR